MKLGCGILPLSKQAFFAVLLSLSALAQQAAQPVQPNATPKPVTGAERLQQWRLSQMPMLMDDFGELARYREANAALQPPAPSENRVVFFGDSITDMWKLDVSFPGKPYINRGISGQTTPQLLIRFRPEVIDLHPKVVVILAGTNDIAGNTGPESLEQIEGNYASMAELARAHEIKVIYASVLPVHEYTPEAGDMFTQRPPEKIVALNRWLKNYCASSSVVPRTSCVYLDYFSAMVDDKGYMKKELADDGLHPNAAGYKIMAPLAEAAIEKALMDLPKTAHLGFAEINVTSRRPRQSIMTMSFRLPWPEGIPRPRRRGKGFDGQRVSVPYISRGRWWKRRRLPVLRRTIGKETAAGISPPCLFVSFFQNKLFAISFWLLARSVPDYGREKPKS